MIHLNLYNIHLENFNKNVVGYIHVIHVDVINYMSVV